MLALADVPVLLIMFVLMTSNGCVATAEMVPEIDPALIKAKIRFFGAAGLISFDVVETVLDIMIGCALILVVVFVLDVGVVLMLLFIDFLVRSSASRLFIPAWINPVSIA